MKSTSRMEKSAWRLRAAQTLCATGVLLSVSACGSGSAAIFGSGSSNSGAPDRLFLVTQEPAPVREPGEFSEPAQEIELVFSHTLDTSTASFNGDLVKAAEIFHLYSAAASFAGGDRFLELVEDVFVDGTTVRLVLRNPLRLGQDYALVIDRGEVLPDEQAIVPYLGNEFRYLVRDGELGGEVLVSFLFPISRVFYRHPDSEIPGSSAVDSVVVIEGADIDTGNGTQDGFVVAVAGIEDSGGAQNPVILFDQADADENQVRLGGSRVSDRGLTSVAFTGGGKSFCSSGSPPKKHIYVSQFLRDGSGWESINPEPLTSGDPPSDKLDIGLDQTVEERWLSWPSVTAHDIDEVYTSGSTGDTTVVAFWSWTDFVEADEDPNDEFDRDDFRDWGIYAVTREEGGDWSAPEQLNDPLLAEAGIPFLLEDPGNDCVYAIWPQTAERIDIYGKLDTNGDGEVPDPNLMGQTDFDAFADGETIDAYWYAVLKDNQWSSAQPLIYNNGKLGRPTSMQINEDGTCAIFWRSEAQGIAAVTADLRSAAPTLSAPVYFDTAFVWDSVFFASDCSKFNGAIEKFINNGVPKSTLIPEVSSSGDSRALVSWVEARTDSVDGDDTGAVMVAEFDLINREWVAGSSSEVSGTIQSETPNSPASIGVASARIDRMGNSYINWSVQERNGVPIDFRSDVFAARRAAGSTLWNGVIDPDDPLAFRINDDDVCANTGGWSGVHESGQLIYSWTDSDCEAGVNLASLLRRFQ